MMPSVLAILTKTTVSTFPKRKQRNDNARAAYREELEREDLNGLFIRDIVKEGILPDDPRLR